MSTEFTFGPRQLCFFCRKNLTAHEGVGIYGLQTTPQIGVSCRECAVESLVAQGETEQEARKIINRIHIP